MTVLLATDFDGTVAPIVAHPDDAVLDPQAAELLARAARRGAALAFVSGRDVDDLTRRTSRFKAWRVGSHGREITAPDGARIREAAPLMLRPSADWLRRAEAAELVVEWKRHSIAAHWRTSPSVRSESDDLVNELREWGTSHGLIATAGRQVLEIGTPSPGKRDALEHVAGATKTDELIYAGDDLTDFPAIEWAAQRGRGYFVASRERAAAPHGAVVVQSIGELLASLERDLDLLLL